MRQGISLPCLANDTTRDDHAETRYNVRWLEALIGRIRDRSRGEIPPTWYRPGIERVLSARATSSRIKRSAIKIPCDRKRSRRARPFDCWRSFYEFTRIFSACGRGQEEKRKGDVISARVGSERTERAPVSKDPRWLRFRGAKLFAKRELSAREG